MPARGRTHDAGLAGGQRQGEETRVAGTAPVATTAAAELPQPRRTLSSSS